MKAILPSTVFIGFTGTPLLKADKQKSIEVFGRYIHAYKFDEAVKDKVVLDLRYEARDIDQRITSQAKIDQWFKAKTNGLTDLAKAQLKQRWGTMKKVLSSQSRLDQIMADIMLDMETRDRLREWPRKRRCLSRGEHLPSVQVLRTVLQDRPEWQVRHRDLLQAIRVRPQGRRNGEGLSRSGFGNTTSTSECLPTGSTSQPTRP